MRECFIENWHVENGPSGPRLVGDLFGHPEVQEGTQNITGTIVALERGIAIGKRTRYRLGNGEHEVLADALLAALAKGGA